MDGKTNIPGSQNVLGYKIIFQRFIVKDWFGANDRKTKYSKLNEMILLRSVAFYKKYWKIRCEKCHEIGERKSQLTCDAG